MCLERKRHNMASESEVDTSRARIQTYVPTYQKNKWKSHADELDMSLSEFVRSMVQAGRRGFSGESDTDDVSGVGDPGGGQQSDANPRGQPLEDRVLSILSEGGVYDWDDLVAAVTDDVEAQLDETLQQLQGRNEIRYSGRDGGYVRE